MADRESNLRADFYRRDAYSSYLTMFSLVEQARWASANDLREVLYIGVGSGFVPAYLRSQGISVTTFDINASLGPDIVGDVAALSSLAGRKYQSVMACEVFEHLPFELFGECVRQMSLVTMEKAFITLPVYRRFAFRLAVALKFGRRELPIGLWLSARKKALPPEHCWEVGSKAENTHSQVTSIIASNFRDVNSSRMRLNPYHHMWDLQA